MIQDNGEAARSLRITPFAGQAEWESGKKKKASIPIDKRGQKQKEEDA
jgi:hypothetical protein